jgi:hypothetical protein
MLHLLGEAILKVAANVLINTSLHMLGKERVMIHIMREMLPPLQKFSF